MMIGSNSHVSTLTLNINGLRAPVKRYRVASWIKNQNPLVYCLQTIHLTCNDTQAQNKRWRKIDQANGKQEIAGVAILVSGKTDFKPT